MNSTEETLGKFGVTSPGLLQLFTEKSAVIRLAKNTHLAVEGERNNSEYILLSGVLHRYNQTEAGDSVTTGFYLPQTVITPHFARTTSGKSIFSLQALTEATVAEIPVQDLNQLREQAEEFKSFGQRIVEAELAVSYQNEIVYRSCNAKQRLLHMRKQYPNLENLVPHQLIASYLGITNVSFSRLRHELLP